MPPKTRRKLNPSSSKKSNVPNNQSQVQPSKFGIQHFFERHSQNALLASQKLNHLSSPPAPPSATPPTNPIPLSPSKSNAASNGAVSVSPNPNLHSHSSPATEAADEVSPLVSKSTSLKRFNFSPGMLIKQSQDDGGDEVTWKISPVNERLLAVSKHTPVLPDSSKHNSFLIHQCSQTKGINTAAKFDKWLSSPSPKGKADKKPLLQANRFGLKRLNPFQDKEVGDSIADENTCLSSRQTPFCTPPSLPYCPDKLANGVASHHLGLKQHKKALLELLDQVEDVISVEDFVSSESEPYSSKAQEGMSKEIPVTADSIGNDVSMGTTNKVSGTSSNGYFLVLEVSEKQTFPESGGSQWPYKVLRLVNEKSGEERAVYLWEEWSYSVIAPGDTVNVIGEFDEEGKCNVDHENNFLIVHPDILVSGTRVAGSFSCPRRTVLDERLRCNEHSTAALIGTLLHQIFQAGLVKESPTVHFLEEYARIVLQKNMESLYACGVNEHEIYKTLTEAIPKLVNWIGLFKDTQEPQVPTVDFGSDNGAKKVEVLEVIDIEELAWAPKYGLKGMIDVSVRVKVDSGGKEGHEKIMPLEFKTGKMANGQASAEHCAQVILYSLLMSERYLKHIDSGLLYYLQSDQTQGIIVRRSDLVGLIMRRNELAHDILKALTTQQLPPMLQIPSMCKGCRHLDVCTLYHKAFGGNTESSGLGDIFDSHVHHFSNAHGVFLRHWDQLIDLEAREMQLAKKEIWRSHNHKNENSTGCLSSLVLDELPQQESHKENRFIYHFVCRYSPTNNLSGSDRNSISAASSLTKDLDCSLKSGDYVILSTESGHQFVATGIIVELSPDRVSVSFSKGLRLPGGNLSSMREKLLQEVWRIDKDEIMTSFSVMRFNLIQMFLDNEQSSHLRKMIVDLAVNAPRFDSGCIFSQDPAISYIWSEKSLNDDQRRAILKILTAKDYALILGMPGTGKTSTMVHAVKALLMRGASILLTSYTNSAVDNLLIKLKSQGIDFVRIGRHESVHEEIKGHCFSGMNINSVEEIKLKFDQVKVVAVTCLGITSPLLSGKKFDVCIIDEAGQTTLPVSLGPLMFSSTFVLVGDHYQLPPLIQSTEAREKGMGISLFCRLSEAHSHAIAPLQSQYRMCQSIMELSNALIYGDRLRCGSPEIANAKLKFTKPISCSSWLKIVLNPSEPVIFVNTDMLPALEARDQKTVNNPMEAYIIAEITDGLVNNGIEGKDIGIITPYNSQASFIRHTCKASVETHTIDRYQGRDKDCILVSFVRSNVNPRSCSASLLADWHRINVALTRPKKKLIMVGSWRTLSKVPMLKLLIDKIDEQSGILSLSNDDFNHRTLALQRCSLIRVTKAQILEGEAQ
ncbi:DNA replication ATP-dependent helicase/nuclease JHS1 isoform X1 [Gossypium hirsutum]|uniref:DNA helicase n=1 Tax=Gossypium hirsutum TaxID=3635 RepID=A0ABM3BN18_GOSHI|nr:DNA replication ATP-dependent helicase/nuclease JHS1-like isoform X1 [Gossypium hirsutum]